MGLKETTVDLSKNSNSFAQERPKRNTEFGVSSTKNDCAT
ncbi:unnamed protein product, partial [Rotaria sp. Silwood1]